MILITLFWNFFPIFLGNPSEFVPTNLAVNFKQGPNRFKTDITTPEEDIKKNEKVVITQNTVVVGDIPVERVIEEGGKDNDPSKATDDLHLTKFKKQFWSSLYPSNLI